jgi:hypothetical protein
MHFSRFDITIDAVSHSVADEFDPPRLQTDVNYTLRVFGEEGLAVPEATALTIALFAGVLCCFRSGRRR